MLLLLPACLLQVFHQRIDEKEAFSMRAFGK
jgi:hypothetical protein